jgi:hypothetical protein
LAQNAVFQVTGGDKKKKGIDHHGGFLSFLCLTNQLKLTG